MKHSIERIEMYGFPGSGKTTTLNIVSKEFPEFQVVQANMKASGRNIISLLKFMVCHPVVLSNFKLLSHLPKAKYKTQLLTSIRFMLRTMTMSQDLKKNKKVIVDEGIAQITWSLLLLPSIYDDQFNVEEALNKIIKRCWPKSNLLICAIQISDDEYLRRVESRERLHYFSREFKRNNIKYTEKGQMLLNLILNKAKELYTVNMYN